jgi:hypothetical protein
MANTYQPFGFRPIMRRDGSAWTGNQTLRKIVATSTAAIMYGDLVAVQGSGYITVGAASATTALGVFVGCRYVPTAFGFMRWSNFWPGSGNIQAAGDIDAYIIDDPGVVWEVQSTGASPLTVADLGLNIDLISSSGSAIGMSQHGVNAATAATTATFPFRVWAVPGSSNPGTLVPNFDPTSANNIIQVVWNNFFGNITTGV